MSLGAIIGDDCENRMETCEGNEGAGKMKSVNVTSLGTLSYH